MDTPPRPTYALFRMTPTATAHLANRRLDAQAAAAEAAALEQELRRMDAEQLRERTQQEAAAEAKTLKQTKADSYEKKGKSLGEWLFGL